MSERKIEVPKDGKAPAKDTVAASQVLQKISAEYEQALRYVQPRRQQFRDRLKLYNNQRRQRDKIGITTIYTMVNTLLAVNYIDELAVGFGGKGISGTDFAENLENVAKNDYEEMELNVHKYLVHWDRFFFGVGIEYVHGWEEELGVPCLETFDPLSWLPDPQGFIRPQSFGFMGFELEMPKSAMTEARGYIKSAVERLNKPRGSGSEVDQTKQARREAQGLDLEPELFKTDATDPVYAVLLWFTVIDGKRYVVTTDLDRTEVLRFTHIEPVFEKEKKNELLTPWGIALHYYSPERGNPFGTSVPDLVEDKQRAKSVLANLKVLKEKADLYPMYVYNREKVLNRRDLDFAFNKFIGVRGDVQGAVEPLRKDTNRLANTENVSQSIDREGELATGATAQQSGVMSADARTLGEAQMIQTNANLRFLLGSRINSWGEKDFWKLWYRCYVRYFDDAEEKVVEITNPFGIVSQSLPAKRFLVRDRIPRIIIRSKAEADQMREKERTAFASVAPLIMQDPTKPPVSRRYAERHLMRLHGVSKEQLDVMVPPTPDEMDAHQENQLLSRNRFVAIELEEDHLSHIVIHMASPDTDAKKVHVEAHRRAYVESGQRERDKALQYAAAQNAQAMAGTAQGQAGSLAAAQSQKPSTGASAQGGMQSQQ